MLLRWRGVKVLPSDNGFIKYEVPTPQEWRVYTQEDYTILILPDVPCSKLNARGLCSIHDRSPRICKDFPRGPLEIPDECSMRWSD